MASKWPPVNGAGFTFRVTLFAQSDNQIKTSPTIAAGDFQVSKDGGAFANLGTTPSESPASSGQVLVTLSASEMTADEVMVRAIDASGAEWHSAAWVIHTVGQTFDTVDGNVDSILTDTGTTLPATLTTIDGIVDDILLDTAAIASLNDLDATEVQTAAAAALTAYDPPTKAELDSAVAPLATAAALTTHDGKLDTVDGIVDAILVDTNELQTNQGNWLTATGFSTHSAADVWAVATRVLTANTNLNDPTAAAIADAILDELTSGHTTAGTVGKALTDILADTDELQTNQGNWATADVSGLATAAALATVDTNVDAILVDTDTTIPGLIAALNNLSAAQVNAEVVDVLRTDTIPDNYPTDGAQPTIAQALLVIQQFLTEKSVSGTTLTVKKPDGSTTAMTFTLDDGDAPTSITRAS